MTPRSTPLEAEHRALGATLTAFGGWLMPLRYTSDLAEHRAVRVAAGMFDLSHMGEIHLEGPGAAAALDHALVGSASAITPGRARYSMFCAEDGSVLDDLIVYRLAEQHFLVVANAGNAGLVARELAARAEGFDVVVDDRSLATALVAVQGPRAEEIVADLVAPADADAVRALPYYAAIPVTLQVGEGIDTLVARTGYTGEDGFELFGDVADAVPLWRGLLAAGGPRGLVPAGLAARKTSPPSRVLVGLRGESRRSARAGYDVITPTGATVGTVTSAAPSPTLGHPIAMAYVTPEVSGEGTRLAVDVRGRAEPFVVVPLPFYRRPAV